jgi:predicted dehydrogenase
MSALERLNVGVVGACGRGGSLAASIEHLDGAAVHAVCDINADDLPAAQERLGAAEGWTDYEEMLERSDLDAVIVGTPMPLHVPQAIMALEGDIHVLSEVPAAVTVEQCRDLVAACVRSRAHYMMAENACYLKHVAIVTEIVRRGLFGELYYGEGEYLHDLKAQNEVTRWRRKWQNGIDGITYGTHALGPLLQWIDWDRVVRVCCEGSGHHHLDPRGEPYCQDTSVMLCATAGGALLKIRQDMVSNRPGCSNNWVLQGTSGTFDSDRCGLYELDVMRVWAEDLCEEHKWMTLADIADQYLPEAWRRVADADQKSGHGGSDYFVVSDFVAAVSGDRPNPIDVHRAMDMTLPGLVSQQSILEDGRWMDVPDSRDWQESES